MHDNEYLKVKDLKIGQFCDLLMIRSVDPLLVLEMRMKMEEEVGTMTGGASV